MAHRYYYVTNLQLFLAAIVIGVIAAGLVTINNKVDTYLQLPVVTKSSDGKCQSVLNFKNGDAFTCNDVGTILRRYRTTP